MTETNVIHC